MKLDEIKHIFFLGIGGIGMSALARYFNHKGLKVKGYDLTETSLTRQLVAEGIEVVYDDAPSHLPENLDLVVYTPAIPKTQRQWLAVQARRDLRVLKRAEVLGYLSREQRCLAVAGTHGKTTTSVLLTHLLRTAGLNCTAFLGGISTNLGSNFVQGSSDYVVVEADEFDRSFLHLRPYRAILTSTDADHLDIYGEPAEVEASYRQFARQVEDKLYYCDGLAMEAETLGFDSASYACGSGDFRAEALRWEQPYQYFDWHYPDGVWSNLALSLAGAHNVENATAALAVAWELGLPEAALREGLRTFKGIKRRFEWVHYSDRGIFIDDYAHHPTELRAAIRAAKALFPNKRILGVFQPHLYSRTRDFALDFASALDELDEAILLEIYPARELPMEGVDSGLIFSAMKLENKQRMEKTFLLESLKNRNIEVLLTLGAGDIGAMVEDLKRVLFDN